MYDWRTNKGINLKPYPVFRRLILVIPVNTLLFCVSPLFMTDDATFPPTARFQDTKASNAEGTWVGKDVWSAMLGGSGADLKRAGRDRTETGQTSPLTAAPPPCLGPHQAPVPLNHTYRVSLKAYS